MQASVGGSSVAVSSTKLVKELMSLSSLVMISVAKQAISPLYLREVHAENYNSMVLRMAFDFEIK